MTSFSAVVRSISSSKLASELSIRLDKEQKLDISGVARLPKGLVVSAIAQRRDQPLCVVTATLEEASRWAAQLESMGWNTVHFYPTTEASPYEPFDLESEMAWGQLQILADLTLDHGADPADKDDESNRIAIVATERSLQPHLPPPSALKEFCMKLQTGLEMEIKDLKVTLANLGYEKVALVETEGQWSQRGDILDIFPVSAELPIRIEWFGEELEKMREFDPATQRSLDKIPEMTLTPTSFKPVIIQALQDKRSDILKPHLTETQAQQLEEGTLEGTQKFLGLAFNTPASLLDYLPDNTLLTLDEPDQCQPHSDRWVEHAQEQWQIYTDETHELPKLHQRFEEAIALTEVFDRISVTELAENDRGLNLSSRQIPTLPHQFGKLAEIVREELAEKYSVWLMSAQPSRSVALLQEHDCPAQFVPNPKDYPAIDKLQNGRAAVGLKYSGLAELEGFILPTFRVMVITDREFFGQHSLSSPSYVRKRRRATSKQVDPNKLRPGDFVVHRSHGIGQFKQLESLRINHETRDYLVVQYADGVLRVAADQLDSLSRFRTTGQGKPQLNKMSGKAWEKTKNKVRKSIKKLAVDLLKLYAERSKQTGFMFPEDQPWQDELEGSFPYVPTPDQLKATQDVKRDMESDRPMDRLVCGDVGFGKTEVAVRAIFKAVTSGKQAAMMAPTTILTQQHYHTLKERFAPYPIQVGLLNRFKSAAERKEIQKRLKTGELDVVVGTQQLLGKSVDFKDLGLLVIDEEQRFGVNQKEKIKAMKTQLDVLTLSATPIPRTLYMSLSGVREMSLITTPPPSRRPIKTHMSPYEAETVRSAIRQELDRGGQVFYVVPRVEGIEEVAGRIREMVPSARIAIAHGQMVEGELEATMLAFSNAEADILLCTTIIESGLDIPRVNTILIEDAQKFGLSQLYQLRGRVGRAGIQAHAWLFYPRRESLTEAARKRLRALQQFTQLGSGYQLAMRDMEIRGVGNLLGAEQSGQLNAIGFDLYMDMLQESINEIKGQEIPKVDETSVELNLTAFIPSDYIPDLDQKMAAYRDVATATSKKELTAIAVDWTDRYGQIPTAALQLMRIVELKTIAKPLGFSKIKPEGRQHVILETPMEEPAWKLLRDNLPEHLKTRFVYAPGKITVRGLGVMKPEQQLENLIDWLSKMKGALPTVESDEDSLQVMEVIKV